MNEIDMREFVYHYTPQGWIENIGKVVFVPYWTNEEYEKFKRGIFPNDMEWYYKEGIEVYFKQKE